MENYDHPMNNVAIAGGSNRRAFFLQATNFLKNYGLEKATISMSKLRVDNLLTTTATNKIQFSPIATDNTASTTANTNTLLSSSDVFLVWRMGFFIGKQVSGSYAKAVLNTYPNATVFAGASEATNLQVIYSGTFQTLINTTQIVPAMSMEQFYYVDYAQFGSASTGTSSFNWETVLNEVQPNPVLFGNMHTEMTVTLPESVALTVGASNNFLTYIAEGIRISGVSQNIVGQILKDLYKIEG